MVFRKNSFKVHCYKRTSVNGRIKDTCVGSFPADISQIDDIPAELKQVMSDKDICDLENWFARRDAKIAESIKRRAQRLPSTKIFFHAKDIPELYYVRDMEGLTEAIAEINAGAIESGYMAEVLTGALNVAVADIQEYKLPPELALTILEALTEFREALNKQGFTTPWYRKQQETEDGKKV